MEVKKIRKEINDTIAKKNQVLKRQTVKRDLDSVYGEDEDEEIVSPIAKQETKLRREKGGLAMRSKARGSKATKEKATSDNTSALKAVSYTHLTLPTKRIV